MWQVLCPLLMVSSCGCDDRLGILADGDPIKPGPKDTSPAVPPQQGDPAFDLEPPLPTQLAAPAAKEGDRGFPPVRSQISSVDTYQQNQQGTLGNSQDGQAYLSPNSIHNSDENQAAVANLDAGNRPEPDKEADTPSFLNNLDAVDALSSTQRTSTDVPDTAAAATTSESSVVKEAKTTQEIIDKEQYRLHEDGYKAEDSQPDHADKPDMGVLSPSADQFPESHLNKGPALQNQSSGGQALNRNSEDDVRNQYAENAAAMLDSFVGPVSGSHGQAETERKTEIQSHSNAVHSSNRDHTVLSSSNINPNSLFSGVPDSRPSLPEDARLSVSHSVSNNTVSPSAERPDVPAENASPEKGIKEKDAGSTTVGTPQQSSSDRPGLASEEEGDDFLHGAYDNDDGGDDNDDDWWYFNPDNPNRKEDKVKFSSSPPWFLSSTPRPGGDEAKDVDDSKESPDLPDIPEKVMKAEDVVEKKNKKISGPKDSIILYTVLIVILITGIVSFSLWKNASKKSRPRNSMSMMPPGEEGKRLLDHPFV